MKVVYRTPLKESHWPWPKMNVSEVAKRAVGNEILMLKIGYLAPPQNLWVIPSGLARAGCRIEQPGRL